MAEPLITYDAFKSLAGSEDLFAAFDHLQNAGTPSQVASTFESLHLEAYWKRKDLPLVITLTTTGIQFCLAHARLAEITADQDGAYSLRSVAKGLAYNLGSFTWPGWDEPGISPTPADVALGLEAARFNLRLAVELKKNADRVRDAHWLLGAHLLAAGEVENAVEHLVQAVPPDGADPYGNMFRGYVLLAKCMASDEASDEWTELLASLEETEGEAATFSYKQLTTAWRALHRFRAEAEA